ncbi:MAG: hypothetical protein WB822_02065 [Rhodoplanes sp.]
MTLARGLKIALAAILAVAAAPFLLALGAGLIAILLGCQLDESDVHPCMISGVDLGYPLYATALTGLIILFGLPFAGAAFFDLVGCRRRCRVLSVAAFGLLS